MVIVIIGIVVFCLCRKFVSVKLLSLGMLRLVSIRLNGLLKYVCIVLMLFVMIVVLWLSVVNWLCSSVWLVGWFFVIRMCNVEILLFV